MPAKLLPPVQCSECAYAGRKNVLMHFVVFDDQWMSVSVAETDTTYRGAPIIRTQRKKVRTAIWRCPHGHRYQHVPE